MGKKPADFNQISKDEVHVMVKRNCLKLEISINFRKVLGCTLCWGYTLFCPLPTAKLIMQKLFLACFHCMSWSTIFNVLDNLAGFDAVDKEWIVNNNWIMVPCAQEMLEYDHLYLWSFWEDWWLVLSSVWAPKFQHKALWGYWNYQYGEQLWHAAKLITHRTSTLTQLDPTHIITISFKQPTNRNLTKGSCILLSSTSKVTKPREESLWNVFSEELQKKRSSQTTTSFWPERTDQATRMGLAFIAKSIIQTLPPNLYRLQTQ